MSPDPDDPAAPMPAGSRPEPVAGNVSPLAVPQFRALWLGALGANTGGWMQNVAAAWLMTSLSASHVEVALVQTAATLPVFLAALPAGALADVVDRRRLLLITQTWMCASAGLLGVLTLQGFVTPWSLLALTFALGLGSALNGPAWQAVTPDVVSREQLPAAVALNSAGFNVSRAVGPALGGVLVAAAGAGAAFLVNAVSFVGVLLVIHRWRPVRQMKAAPEERFLSAIRAGTRYVRHDPALRVVLVRAGPALLCAASIWALLPLVARDRLGLGSFGYGILLGCLGIGAVTGATVMSRLTRRFGADAVVNASSLLFAAVMALSAVTTSPYLVSLGLLFGGAAWMGLMSTFNTVTQLVAPGWAKGRALAAYLLVTQGGLAIGSALWGLAAERTSLTLALLVSAGGLAATVPLTRRFALQRVVTVDRRISAYWPEPVVPAGLGADDGPVRVTVEYRVLAANARPFLEAMQQVRLARLRDGAVTWGVYRDLADDTRYVEAFLVDSWAEHQRQHARVTFEDRELESRARRFHVGPEPVRITHYIAASTRSAVPGTTRV